MRRVLPWALLGVLGLAALVGAGLGLAGQPAVGVGLQMSQVITATRAAGTARFAYSSVTSSENPVLRSTSRGHGSVDFKTNSTETVETDTSTGISQEGSAPSQQTAQILLQHEIWIGRTAYFRVPIAGAAAPWFKAAPIPAKYYGPLGVFENMGPLSQYLSDVETPGSTIERLGTQTLHGAETIEYRVAPPSCLRASETKEVEETRGPTYVWVDGAGRLAQVSGSTQTNVLRAPAGAPSTASPFRGRSTIVSTVRLFDFGSPVTVSPPKLLPNDQGHTAAMAFLVHTGCS